jgi:solute:Na+ symporter, SSS family
MILASLPRLDSTFTWQDWLVIAAYLLLSTLIGARLAGKQSSIRDFFLAGRKLPWWAITGSMIATEISAVTFVAVPTMSYAKPGNLTYIQWAAGTILARIVIGLYFVPKYYEREIYSPYDYLERKLGLGVKKVTTGLFLVGAVLGQGARLYITAFVLSAITNLDLISSIWIIGAFSVCWALLGGMTTVIWTDVIQFLVFTVGAVLALYWGVSVVPGGARAVIETAQAADKFRWFDGSTDLSMEYTIWIGLLAMPFMNLAALGTDQVMAQRIFCCRSQRDASKAIIASSIAVGVALLMLGVGIALFCYFKIYPFSSPEAALYSSNKNYLLPIFIVRAMPMGVRGLVVAAIFAAAISTLDGALTALAQTTLDLSAKARASTGRRRAGLFRKLLSNDMAASRALVVVWGVVLCLMGMACILIARNYANAVELAFALVGYTYGPMLGIFLLAFLPTGRDHSGLLWAVPMSILAIFGMYVHGAEGDWTLLERHWPDWIVWIGAAVILLLILFRSQKSPPRVAAVVAGTLVIVLLHQYRVELPDGTAKYLAFNWSYPIGTAMTFALGYCLGKPARH